MTAPLLQTRDLSIHFGGVKAVDNVNFTLAQGGRCVA
jgi:branched-chain amino acid transport system ATP-binding protein